MSSLVMELQRDALDGAVDVSALLRKAYTVSVKLKLDKFREWCSCELNGYGRQELPSYRHLPGELLAWNPYNGWIPVVFEDRRTLDLLSMHREIGPIAAIQDLVSNSSGKGFEVKLNPRLQQQLMEESEFPFRTSLHLGRGSLVKILDAVRNTILDWSLKLESDGIMGLGLTFSTQEMAIANAHSDDLQSAVNFITIGTMVNSTIQQGSRSARLNSSK